MGVLLAARRDVYLCVLGVEELSECFSYAAAGAGDYVDLCTAVKFLH